MPILESRCKEIAGVIIKGALDLLSNNEVIDFSLFQGLASVLIVANDEKLGFINEDSTCFIVDTIQSSLGSLTNLSHGAGLSGIAWLFEVIQSDCDYDPEINSEIELLILRTLEVVDLIDIEFLYGLSGVGLFANKRASKTLTSLNFEIYKKIKIGLDESLVRGEEFDLGLAHGVFGPISFLSDFINLVDGDIKKEASTLLNALCSYTLKQSSTSENGRFFGYKSSEKPPFKTRLGWCYGDLSNSLILAKAAASLKNRALFYRARKIALSATLISHPDSLVVDHSICHGSAGLIILYKRAFEIFGDSEFLACSEYWCRNIVLDYNEKSSESMDSFFTAGSLDKIGFLEGDLGVALGLIHFYQTNNLVYEMLGI